MTVFLVVATISFSASAIAVSIWVFVETKATNEVVRRTNDVCREVGLESDLQAMALPKFRDRRREDRGSIR